LIWAKFGNVDFQSSVGGHNSLSRLIFFTNWAETAKKSALQFRCSSEYWIVSESAVIRLPGQIPG
jgi:hypothetical protein